MTRSLEVEDRPDVRQSINRARSAIEATIETGPSPQGDVAYIEEQGIAKLNAAALYLLALVELKNQGFSLTSKELSVMPQLATGLRQMRENSGGFRYLYFMPREENRITPYGSSEAVLALAAYARQTGDDDLAAFAHDSFTRYYQTFLSGENRTFDDTNMRGYFSWALHAQVLLQDNLERAYQGPIRTMLQKAMAHRHNNPFCAKHGCIDAPTLSDAPFLEGILAALPLVRRYETDADLIAQTHDYAARALRLITNLQITDDIDAILAASPRPPSELIGGFCESQACTLMRNDLAQHALITLITFHGQECAA